MNPNARPPTGGALAWRAIPGHGRYQISPDGRIRRMNKGNDPRRTPAYHEVQTVALLMVAGRRRHVVVRDLIALAFPEGTP